MKAGISVNGKHTYHSFGLRMLRRSIGSAPKDDHTARVPYSNVTYDFDSILGRSYGERPLSYKFEFICFNVRHARDRIIDIINWLHWNDRLDLTDDMFPGYYFEVREPSVEYSESHGIYTFSMSFKASPEMKTLPEVRKYNASTVTVPDINGDGTVDSSDASIIQEAYARIIAGEDTGLTPKQLKACDANMDGSIDSADASLVMTFYADATSGKYAGLTVQQAWAEFLTEHFETGDDVL